MRFVTLAILALLGSIAPIATQAQLKVGYTNVELLLSLMPETRQVEQQLRTHQSKLSEKITIRRNYAQEKAQEFNERVQKGATPTEQGQMEAELQRLRTELDSLVNDAENRLQQKRDELLSPVLEKLQKAIEEVAKAEGYTYVLNTGTGGSTTILFAPDGDNLTEKVLKKLGIELPKEGAATPGTTVGGPATPAPGAPKPGTAPR